MTRTNQLITALMYAPILGAFVVGTVYANEPTPVYEQPLAPCHHVIMQSAPDTSDGGVLAYCAGSQFFVYDQDDTRWHHMTIAYVRGVGYMPIRDEYVITTQEWADGIGDQRAAGVYE